MGSKTWMVGNKNINVRSFDGVWCANRTASIKTEAVSWPKGLYVVEDEGIALKWHVSLRGLQGTNIYAELN